MIGFHEEGFSPTYRPHNQHNFGILVISAKPLITLILDLIVSWFVKLNPNGADQQ